MSAHPVAVLPVLHTLQFSVVISTLGSAPNINYSQAVRDALIAVLPPGTGVCEVTCHIVLNDAYNMVAK